MKSGTRSLLGPGGRPLHQPKPERPILPNPLPPVLDKLELMVLLHLPDVRSVERLIARREIPYVPIGGRNLFLTESIIETLRKRERWPDESTSPRDRRHRQRQERSPSSRGGHRND